MRMKCRHSSGLAAKVRPGKLLCNASAADIDDFSRDRCWHMPLVFAHGPGAGARNSIGIMLVSGMIIGTAFTLFVVPAVYMLVAKNHNRDLESRDQRRSRTEERKLQPVLA
jgi:hypothetical protein